MPGGAATRARVVILGQRTVAAPPDCPSAPGHGCQAIGRVTGFQVGADHERNLFRMPFLGKAVAWSVNVARPTRSEAAFFDRFFGGPPKARLAILRRVRGARRHRFELVRQGPPRLLSGYRGRRVTFGVKHPLWARRGDIVAITLPTWAPVLSTGGSGRWRASRRAGGCDDPAVQKAGHPQQRTGSRRPYGCVYSGARLTYSATVVRAPRAARQSR